jgi:hypothetical protein
LNTLAPRLESTGPAQAGASGSSPEASSLTQVWNCGGGTQSVAIAALIVQGRLPKPDVSLIVDTGREVKSTWDYMAAVLVSELAKVGITLHKVSKEDFATCDLWSTNGATLEIPAFTTQSGEVSKLPNFCSNEWKRRVADRWLRAHGFNNCRKWLGFALDEPRRWLQHADSAEVWLPLVHGVPLRSRDCRSLVAKMGWPIPKKSRCWMCPNQSDDEWREVVANPSEFAAAVGIDRKIRKKDPFAFLHSSGVPLDQVDWAKPQLEFERACNSGECFV